MWSVVEVNIGITCACIPTLKPVVTWAARYLPRRSSIWTSDSKLLSTSRHLLERGPTTERRGNALTGPSNHHSSNLTEFGGESYSQLDIDLGTTPQEEDQFSNFASSPNSESMINLSTKQSIRPLLIINTLCFIIGLAEGNLWDINCKFSILSKMSQLQVRATYALY